MSDFKLAKRKISGTLDHVIGGAGSDIESTTARTEIIANALRPCKTSDEYVREIRKLWAEAQAKFLAIGRYLVTAKANLDVYGKRGDYERMIANDLPFSRQIAHQLRVVAEAVDSGRLTEGELPQAYSTAFLLASLPDEQLAVARQRGLVSPLVARARVLEFRRTLMPRDLWPSATQSRTGDSGDRAAASGDRGVAGTIGRDRHDHRGLSNGDQRADRRLTSAATLLTLACAVHHLCVGEWGLLPHKFEPSLPDRLVDLQIRHALHRKLFPQGSCISGNRTKEPVGRSADTALLASWL